MPVRESPPPPGAGIGLQHPTGLRVDLLDAVFGDLKEVPAVEGRPGMRGHVDRAQHLTAVGIDGLQLVAGCQPDVAAVVRDSVDAR